MRCDDCGSGDSLFVVLSENSRGETRLCRACALGKGYLSNEGVAALPQLDSLLDQLDKPGETEAICPECGMGQEQLVGFGRLGCPMCVQVFKRQYLLARKRRGLPGGYAGRIPHACMADPKKVEPGLDGEPSVRQGVFLAPEAHGSSQLLADIESAVLVEDFEKAAFLRDCLASSRVKGKQADDS